MNDFTKDELKDIENGLGWLCEANPFSKVEVGKLMSKVRLIIENYCEHENTDDCKSCNSIICLDCEEREDNE